ncbi:hypothetical protein Tco_1308679, partial [Tanacetum coccineum]
YLKTDSENDNEKVNKPLFLSPEPTVSCIDNLDFFKEFENEFPALVYNDALTSKSDLSIEPTLCPQDIDKFDLKEEASLFKNDEVEKSVLYFNDLFHFNIIYPDDQKSDKGNDENEIDMIQSAREQYGVEEYTEDMDLAERMRMVYTRDDGQEVFMIHAWRRLFGIRAPLVQEFLLELFSTYRIGDEMGLDVAGTLCFQLGEDRFRAYWLGSERLVFDKGDLSDNWIEISSSRDFLRGAPSYTYIKDPVRRLCHKLISYSISRRGMHLKRHTKGRKSRSRLSRGHFIRRLAHYFGLVSDDRLRGLYVVARELPLINMGELVALVGSPGAAEDGPAVDEGVQADPTPIQAPQQPPPHLLLRGLVERSMIDQGRFSTLMITCMAQLMKASRQTYQEFDETFRGCSPIAFQRRTRQRTGEANTSIALQQPDP